MEVWDLTLNGFSGVSFKKQKSSKSNIDMSVLVVVIVHRLVCVYGEVNVPNRVVEEALFSFKGLQ